MKSNLAYTIDTFRGRRYVTCTKCKTIDTPKRGVSTGTRLHMTCPDCSVSESIGINGEIKRVNFGLATMCRSCCPTGHGTRFKEEVK